jgi:methyl-accepting chemotaxis protein
MRPRMLLHGVAVTVIFGLLSLMLWLGLPQTLAILSCALLLFGYLQLQPTSFAGSASADTAASHNAPAQSQIAQSGQLITAATSRMAIGAAEVSFYIDGLTKDIQQVGTDSQQISSVASTLTQTSAELSENLQHISRNVQQTAEGTNLTDQRLQAGVARLAELAVAVTQAASQLQLLRSSADNIQRITEVIHSVADQTNLLALNAAIEAARAGEAGRGFAVVADEVRTLAGKTSTATRDISQMLQDIRQQSSQTGAQMDKLVEISNSAQQELQAVARGVNDISGEIKQASGALSQIDQTGNGLLSASQDISRAIENIHQGLAAIEGKSATVAEQAVELSVETESIYREINQLQSDTFFAPVLKEATQAAVAIGQLFQQAISQGKLDEKALFSEQYQPINNTKPPKYHTSYDGFTDQHFPSIQEPILGRLPQALYAGAVDRKGYFPTHNNKFCQPLTGDYQKDLLQNRTKRIFNDRTGSRCGSNTAAMLLQTYKRDTGEILHDLSVPIFVNGRHWGGFRIGFKRG